MATQAFIVIHDSTLPSPGLYREILGQHHAPASNGPPQTDPDSSQQQRCTSIIPPTVLLHARRSGTQEFPFIELDCAHLKHASRNTHAKRAGWLLSPLVEHRIISWGR